ncbi:hypothetical protein R6Q57_027289 [Mikania cordata]
MTGSYSGNPTTVLSPHPPSLTVALRRLNRPRKPIKSAKQYYPTLQERPPSPRPKSLHRFTAKYSVSDAASNPYLKPVTRP